eukprot:Amastigsp_a841739_209.p2 type:complete len:223 gc:universal Amastigsp_a841739_209:233-901(+)
MKRVLEVFADDRVAARGRGRRARGPSVVRRVHVAAAREAVLDVNLEAVVGRTPRRLELAVHLPGAGELVDHDADGDLRGKQNEHEHEIAAEQKIRARQRPAAAEERDPHDDSTENNRNREQRTRRTVDLGSALVLRDFVRALARRHCGREHGDAGKQENNIDKHKECLCDSKSAAHVCCSKKETQVLRLRLQTVRNLRNRGSKMQSRDSGDAIEIRDSNSSK